MIEPRDDSETAGLAIGIMDQHGAAALDHIVTLIVAAVRNGDDDAVRKLDRAMRYIEQHR